MATDIQQKIKLSVETCAFSKDISLEIFPDVAFAAHIQIGKPQDFKFENSLYFRKVDIKSDFTRGLKKEIKEFRKNKNKKDEFKKIMPTTFLDPIINEIIFSYIEIEAEKICGSGSCLPLIYSAKYCHY